MDSLELYATAAWPSLSVTTRSGEYGWTVLESPDPSPSAWGRLAISEDGERIATFVLNGYIFTSNDAGLSWVQRTSAGLRGWQTIACSADGVTIAAGDFGGYVYLSGDGGASWTAQSAIGIGDWYGVSVSADGLKIAAAAGGGSVYVSSNGGGSWTQQSSLGTKQWRNVEVSADGSVLAALEYPGYIYLSSNGGTSWAANTAAGSRNWWFIDFTPDLQKIIASASNDLVYVSTDHGASWSAASVDAEDSRSVAVSSDGSVMLASNGVDFWSSLDNGQNWTGYYGADVWQFSANQQADIVAIISNQGLSIEMGFESSLTVPDVLELDIYYTGMGLDADFAELTTYQTDFITDLAWPELSGSITVGDSYSASLPVSGSGVMLLATLDSATAVIEAAPIQFQATLFMGVVFELATTIAPVNLSAAIEFPVDSDGALVAGGVELSASISIGTVLSFTNTAATVSLSTSYLLGSLFSASIVPSGGIRLGSENIVTALEYGGSMVAAFPWLAVDLRLYGGGSVEVWLVNARTRGMAQYSNYPFTAFAMLGNGLMLAGAADGLYLMDSTTDAGNEIVGVVEVGTADMGGAVVKYVPDAVIDCEGSGDIALSVISGGGKIREYSTSIDHQGLQQNKRVKLAKGIKSRYWSARLSLPVGVSVASLELRPDATRRTS